MNQHAILYPLFAMFILTVIVAGTMLRRRIAFYKTNRVHPQKTATSAQMSAAIEDTRASDNFRNLFEVPVLFYTVVLAIAISKQANVALVALAWAYVAARYAHSYIHCGSNVVMRRFYVFFTSCTVLTLMWALFAFQLLTA
jgi:hypothetical protein